MNRQVIPINQGWQFSLGESFSETVIDMVNLPHTVSLVPAISSGCLNYQGKCCYRKELSFHSEDIKQRVVLRFEGIMGTSVLSVNHQIVARHYCGYTPLVCDITKYITADSKNLIEVFADNSDDEEVPVGKPQGELDFSYDGGIYRGVQLIKTSRLYITDALIEDQVAGGGIFFYCKEVKKECANVAAKVSVRNETGGTKEFTLLCELKQGDKKVASVTGAKIELNDQSEISQTLTMSVKNPCLWDPNHPNLYTLVVSVISDDCIMDCESIEVGIRRIEMTPEDGVLFNGESFRLSGGNYHSSYPYIGNAMPDSLLVRDAIKMKRIGTMSIRSHYPLADSFTNACDRLGMTMIVSNPGWQFFKDTEMFKENAYRNLREIIRWKRNHPCIIMWEHILNETVLPKEFIDHLYEIVHEEYPYQECYCAADSGRADVYYKGFDLGMIPAEKTIYGDGSNSQANLRWIREYGDVPDNFTDQNCAWRSPRWFGDGAMVKSVLRMLGKDSQNPYGNYINMYNNKTLCGYGIWPLIEHNRGYHIAPCYGGHMDLFRIPKFSYYFMESQKDPKPGDEVLYIANWLSETSPDDLMVFSNADRVRLYFDGKFIAEQSPDVISVKHPPFTFHNVISTYRKRGRFTVTAVAITDGKEGKTVQLKSPGVAKRLQLYADTEGIQPIANGSDVIAVHCKVVDEEGNVVGLNADRFPIQFTVSGEGELIGDEKIGANPVCPNAGIATVLIKTTKVPGKISVKADFLWNNHNFKRSVVGDELVMESESGSMV